MAPHVLGGRHGLVWDLIPNIWWWVRHVVVICFHISAGTSSGKLIECDARNGKADGRSQRRRDMQVMGRQANRIDGGGGLV